jgi:hypothetical protein
MWQMNKDKPIVFLKPADGSLAQAARVLGLDESLWGPDTLCVVVTTESEMAALEESKAESSRVQALYRQVLEEEYLAQETRARPGDVDVSADVDAMSLPPVPAWHQIKARVYGDEAHAHACPCHLVSVALLSAYEKLKKVKGLKKPEDDDGLAEVPMQVPMQVQRVAVSPSAAVLCAVLSGFMQPAYA